MSVYDAPNQQVVREDGSGPGIPAEGETPEAAAEMTNGDGLDTMTKEELLDYAVELGVTPANASMTKADLRAGIDAKLAEGAAG